MFSLFLLLALPVLEAVSAEALHDNSPSCTCYAVTSDSSPTYFLYHRFYDFRYLGGSIDHTGVPPTVTLNTGQELTPDQDALNNTAFASDWGITNWGKKATSDAPVQMQNSAANVYITQSNSTDLATTDPAATSYLTLRTVRLPDFQSTAEIENEQKNLMYASIRFRARVVGSSGAVAGLFTFVDDNNEADVEILTRDPNSTYRFTNQPALDKKGNEVPSASQAPTDLPLWSDWRVHRIDWVKGMVRWYVDGQLVAKNSYSVPRKPSGIVMNMWSDGGEWGGNMTQGGSAELHVQWVQVAFNTSGKREGPGKKRGGQKRSLSELEDGHDHGLNEHPDDTSAPWFQKRKSPACSTVCAIDDVSQIGTPEVRFTAAAPPRAAATDNLLLALWLALGTAFLLL